MSLQQVQQFRAPAQTANRLSADRFWPIGLSLSRLRRALNSHPVLRSHLLACMREVVRRCPAFEFIANPQLAPHIQAKRRYGKRHGGPPNGAQYAGGGVLRNQGFYDFFYLVL